MSTMACSRLVASLNTLARPFSRSLHPAMTPKVKVHGFAGTCGCVSRSNNGSQSHTIGLRGDPSLAAALCGTSSASARTMASATNSGGNMLFRQLLDYQSYTYTYLLADPATREAILIDPVLEMVDRDVALVRDLGLTLTYALNTHVHADHVTGTGEIKKRVAGCRSVISAVSKAQADVKISDGDQITFGPFVLECYSTPGHTDGCMSFVLRSQSIVFTGDAVLIRGCGRTDFQQGDAGRLYDSVHSKILSLPHNFKILPAHDYTGQTSSTVGEELQHNRRLTRTRDEFIQIMKNLNLPYPKQIDRALPANMVCGVFDAADS